jgi:flagellar hook-length control protein FliK
MVITISAYTEPVPVNAVNEIPQANEEEDFSDSEFAQLLAGLLQNTEKIQTDIPVVEFSEPEVNIDAIPVDELIDSNEKLCLFENAAEIAKPNENNAFDNEIQVDYLNALTSVENLLNSSLKTEVIDTEHFQDESVNKLNVNHSQEAEFENNLSLTDFLEDVSFSVDTAFFEETLSETDNKTISSLLEKAAKDRIFSPKDNVETLPNTQKPDLIKKPENENRSRFDDTRSRSRRDKVTLEVRDLRTETDTVKIQRSSVMEASVKRTGGEASAREITLELRLPYEHSDSAIQQGQILETKSGNSGSVNSAFENLLSRELHQNFNGDIVRHASIALRDSGEGTIKISLKPESLGNVKIHLEMTENKITGQILVESKEALNAFRKEIASLEQAFRDSGFTNADLNLSLTSNGQNAQGREQDASSFTPMMAASRYDDSTFFNDEHNVLLADYLIERKPGSINMLA